MFWKAAVLTTTKAIFCLGHMLPITFYNDYHLFVFVTTQFYWIFPLQFVSLAQSKKGPPYLGKTSPLGRESWWQWLHIVKLTMKATAPSSRGADSTYCKILFVDKAHVLKFYFLSLSLCLQMLHFSQT